MTCAFIISRGKPSNRGVSNVTSSKLAFHNVLQDEWFFKVAAKKGWHVLVNHLKGRLSLQNEVLGVEVPQLLGHLWNRTIFKTVMKRVVVIIVKWYRSSLAFSGRNPRYQNTVFLLSQPDFHHCIVSMWCWSRICL